MAHDIEDLSRVIVATFPRMDVADQRLARQLYRQLARGRPLPLSSLGRFLALPDNQVMSRIQRLGYTTCNQAGEITGFLGISTDETRHGMSMNGNKSYAWCAWDTLFIPELAGAEALVTSSCASTGQPIRLMVTPEGARSDEAADIVVSFLAPDQEKIDENVVSHFCCHVNFFCCREAGKEWTSRHEGTFLLSLKDAFETGRRVNAARYAAVLEKN